MRIMAVVALDQPFIHSMMERTSELRPHVHVAAVAEFRRGFLQEEFRGFRVVRRMTIEAGYATLQMG